MVWSLLTVLFVAALVLLVGFESVFGDALSPWLGGLPKDPMLAALAILNKAPVIVCISLITLYKAHHCFLIGIGRSHRSG